MWRDSPVIIVGINNIQPGLTGIGEASLLLSLSGECQWSFLTSPAKCESVEHEDTLHLSFEIVCECVTIMSDVRHHDMWHILKSVS